MFIVYIDDAIATVTSSPVAAELYADQLRNNGFDDVYVVEE